MIYVWLAFLAAGQLRPLWRWIQRNRAESWPIASAAVYYNPNKPSKSTLSEPSIEALLQARPPKTSTDYNLSAPKSSLPALVRQFLWVFIILAFVGLVASVWVDLGAVMGRRVVPEAFSGFFTWGFLWFGSRQC
jgi:hypothetical protein